MLKIGIVDDHQLIRKSLTMLVNSFDGMEVAFDAENGAVLIEKLKSADADVLLLDLQMPVMDGYETCTILHERYPDIKILVISQLISKESIHKALGSGAHGYFTKNSDPVELESAIRSIHKTGFYFDTGINATLHEIIFWDKKVEDKNPLSILSAREIQIIKMSGCGLSNGDIATKLFINIRTVETHRKRIMEKTSMKNFTSVILLAIKYGYLSVEDL